MARRDFDPYAAFNYLLEIQGVTQAGFSEVTGLNVENTPIEYRRGSDKNNHVTKQPGLMKYGNITLKRGVTQSFDLIDWLKKVENGVIERANVSITLQDENHQEVLKWNLFEAWPCKWTGPDLKASADEMAIETLEICIERLETQKV